MCNKIQKLVLQKAIYYNSPNQRKPFNDTLKYQR